MKDLFFKTIMLKGEAGGTIAKIEKTGSSLNVDTYTITLNDGETQTFEVTNGSSIASIEKTDTSGLLDTYTVTLTDGSTTQFVVRNGEDGAGYEVPAGSVLFYDPDGDDSAPEGYEASSDPNGSVIAALERGLDNNLLFQGLLCAYKSEPVGWSTYVMSFGGNSPVFVENGGYFIPAGCKILLNTPKFQPYTEFIGNVFDGATYSISVMYMSEQDGIVKTATQEALAYLQETTEDIVNEDGIVIRLNSGIMNEVALYIENNTEEDLFILGVKLERGDNATPFRLEGQAVGSGTAIAKCTEPYSGLTWFHDSGANTKSMSGALSAVGTWITDNFISNKWIGCKVVPTDSSGYFGSSSFSVLANCSSANYGVAQLMSDNPNKSALVIGQLVGGAWTWKAVSTTAIS